MKGSKTFENEIAIGAESTKMAGATACLSGF